MPSRNLTMGVASTESIKGCTTKDPKGNTLRRSARLHIRRYRKGFAMTQQTVALQFLCLTGIDITSIGANIHSGKQSENHACQNHHCILLKPFHDGTTP